MPHCAVLMLVYSVPSWRSEPASGERSTPVLVPTPGECGVKEEYQGESTLASAHAYRMSWVYVLEETQAHHTRLITRGRLGNVPLLSPTSGKPFLARFATPSEFLEPIILKFPRPVKAILMRLVHFIMQQRQLVGIKQRAEREALAGSSSSEERRAAKPEKSSSPSRIQ